MRKIQYLKNVASLRLDSAKCTGCKMCVMVCPHGVFTMQSGKAQIVDIDDCMECGACALNCKFDAISIRSGVGCAAGIINGILKNSEPSCGCSRDAKKGKSSCGC